MTPHVPSDADRPGVGSSFTPPRSSSMFAATGAFVRDPRGGANGKGPIEDAAGLAAAGFRWVAFNLRDHEPDTWNRWYAACYEQGLRHGAWGRCHTAQDVLDLLDDAFSLACRFVIVNLEQEPTEPRWLVEATTVRAILERETIPVAVSTEPWLPDNFAWDLLDKAGIVCLPQAFWNERSGFTPPAVVTRARSQFTRVYPTVGVYPVGARPVTMETLASFYKHGVGVGQPFSVYCSDDVPDWNVWAW